ncbi:hypothetical protein CRENBAI_008118 [Crenichthys baileyi]|uniref:Uncharacterized protein n=1 Tax=Crenichthys baileyi TaxID=28760 RepID=A0AAV9R399_9TELE
MEAFYTPAEPSEDGPAAAPASEASESTSPVSLMTPNSTPAPEAPASPQLNHQDQTEVQREEEEEGAHVSLADRLSEAEEKIKVLHSSLNTAQTELLELRCKYNQEMANKATAICLDGLDTFSVRRSALARRRSLKDHFRNVVCHMVMVVFADHIPMD